MACSAGSAISGEPVFDAHGRFRGYRGVGKDITERKQAQQRQAIEYAVCAHPVRCGGMSDAMPEIIRAVCETMGWDYGARWQYRENDSYYSCAELWFRDSLRRQRASSPGSAASASCREPAGLAAPRARHRRAALDSRHRGRAGA